MEPEPVNQPPEGESGQVDGAPLPAEDAPGPSKRAGKPNLGANPRQDGIDDSHPYKTLLRQLTNLAQAITRQLNKEPPGSLLRDYLACLGFAIARDITVVDEKGVRHFGWKFKPFRELYRAIKWAAKRNRMSIPELRKELAREEWLANKRAMKYGNRLTPSQDDEKEAAA